MQTIDSSLRRKLYIITKQKTVHKNEVIKYVIFFEPDALCRQLAPYNFQPSAAELNSTQLTHYRTSLEEIETLTSRDGFYSRTLRREIKTKRKQEEIIISFFFIFWFQCEAVTSERSKLIRRFYNPYK